MKKTKESKPARIGRPPVGPMLSIRVPDADKAAWEAKAQQCGLTLSEWMRTTLNRAYPRR